MTHSRIHSPDARPMTDDGHVIGGRTPQEIGYMGEVLCAFSQQLEEGVGSLYNESARHRMVRDARISWALGKKLQAEAPYTTGLATEPEAKPTTERNRMYIGAAARWASLLNPEDVHDIFGDKPKVAVFALDLREQREANERQAQAETDELQAKAHSARHNKIVGWVHARRGDHPVAK